MTDIIPVIVCPTCRISWPVEASTPACVDASHPRRHHELHRHRTPVVLPCPDGGAAATILAVSFDEAAPYDRIQAPDFGLYLDDRWSPPWPHEHVDWPDFGVPSDADALQRSLRSLLARATSGEAVEMGCLGAHGRTGTALACLAVLAGHPPADAVEWVRANHCDRAVETPAQVEFVAQFAARCER